MSDDIGPLRPAGERKVFHDRHGHVAGAMSAHKTQNIAPHSPVQWGVD